MLKDERSELDALRLRLHERARDLEEREAGVDRRGEEIAKTNASFGVRQAEFAAQKKEHEELLATDIRLEKEIAKARQRRDDIKQEVTSLETRKSDLLEEITSQGRILCDLEEKNQKLRGQGTATVDEALTGLVPTRSTLAQPAHGPNSARPPTSQRSPLHGTSAIGAMSHSPHSSPASKPKPPSGAHMMSEFAALQLQHEVWQQDGDLQQGAMAAEMLAQKETEDRERQRQENRLQEMSDFQVAQRLAREEQQQQQEEQHQAQQRRQQQEQMAVRESQTEA
eukprot:scpid96510/ scgid2452/ 